MIDFNIYMEQDIQSLSNMLQGIINLKTPSGISNLELKIDNTQEPKNKFVLSQDTYPDFLVMAFTKFIRDELTSALVYAKIARLLKQEPFPKTVLEVGAEEYEHYTEILQYLLLRGLEIPKICINPVIVNSELSTVKEYIDLLTTLEKNTINDYKAMILIAKRFEDVETCEFFRELLNDELEHFKKFSSINGDILSL